jgi:hypothetical protein
LVEFNLTYHIVSPKNVVITKIEKIKSKERK